MRIEVRGDNVNVSEHTRQLIDRKTRLALGRMGGAIRNIRIVLKDLNGPKQGVDQGCSIQVQLNLGGEVHVSGDDQALHGAIDRALDRAARSTARLLARRQGFSRQGLRATAADGPRY
ncbi:MAG: HPF/RaiA family ribosome-associated protein [Thermoanaerobaculia bacterium]